MNKEFIAKELVMIAKELISATGKSIAVDVVGKIPAKEEFKVGDVLDPQGKTNMVGKIIITEIKGNTLKFVDFKGTHYFGMQRSLVRNLVNGGSWKRVASVVAATGIF